MKYSGSHRIKCRTYLWRLQFVVFAFPLFASSNGGAGAQQKREQKKMDSAHFELNVFLATLSSGSMCPLFIWQYKVSFTACINTLKPVQDNRLHVSLFQLTFHDREVAALQRKIATL